MKIKDDIYLSDYLNEFANKCHRYRWFLIGSLSAAILFSVIGMFFSPAYYWSSYNFADNLYFNSGWAVTLSMLIIAGLTVMINLPGEQRYQIMCAKGKFTPLAVNSSFALMLALFTALIATFSPAFVSTIAILTSLGGHGVYENLIYAPSELLLDFGYNMVVACLVMGSINKFMYYLYTKPIMIVFWLLSAGATAGLMILSMYLYIYLSESYWKTTKVSIFVLLLISTVIYELINVVLRAIIVKKGEISR